MGNGSAPWPGLHEVEAKTILHLAFIGGPALTWGDGSIIVAWTYGKEAQHLCMSLRDFALCPAATVAAHYSRRLLPANP
ncbi:hypothetical protein GCM10008941_27640 [Rhizomicrobium palustre]